MIRLLLRMSLTVESSRSGESLSSLYSPCPAGSAAEPPNAIHRHQADFLPSGIDTTRNASSINYVTAAKDYWRVPIQSVSAQGEAVSGVVS